MAAPSQLSHFLDAIRAKDYWYFKILDNTQDLGKKWAAEADLLGSDGTITDDVSAALDELKAEARRIRALDHTIRVRTRPTPTRAVDFDRIDAAVEDTLRYARGAKYAIRGPPLRERVGVYVSDGLVPAILQTELTAALDALADVEPKDFHPGTAGKVQDLIHPSLYPYVADVTPLVPGATRPPHVDGQFVTFVRTEYSSKYTSKYAWIPSVFHVNDAGTDVHIESYINGLGPRSRFPALYRLIEQVFLVVLPHLEKVLAVKYEYAPSHSVLRWKERRRLRKGSTRAEWDAKLARQQENKEKGEAIKAARRASREAKAEQERADRAQFANADTTSSLKGQSLKVIVKAANYCLRPGEAYEGTWHMEGMPHERIVASAIYYYDTDPAISERGLALRRTRAFDVDFPLVNKHRHEHFEIKRTYAEGESANKSDDNWDYPSDWEQVLNKDGVMEDMSHDEITHSIALGTVPTANTGGSTGRIVAFPNWIQHKVEEIRNATPVTAENHDSVARRKILCFFLVQDDDLASDTKAHHGFTYRGLAGMHVLTTADVLPQARGANLPTLRFLLPAAWRARIGRTLPPELVEQILGAGDLGMAWEEAEKTRRAVMRDRSPQDGDMLWETYSLCEH